MQKKNGCSGSSKGKIVPKRHRSSSVGAVCVCCNIYIYISRSCQIRGCVCVREREYNILYIHVHANDNMFVGRLKWITMDDDIYYYI